MNPNVNYELSVITLYHWNKSSTVTNVPLWFRMFIVRLYMCGTMGHLGNIFVLYEYKTSQKTMTIKIHVTKNSLF